MAEPVRIYVDTSVFFDLLDKNMTLHEDTQEPRWKSAKRLFEAISDGRATLAASGVVEAEVGCLATVREGTGEVISMLREWFSAPATEWTDADRFLARDATRLIKEWHPKRAEHRKRMGGADALHLAAAIRLKCDYLMTQDGGFPIGHTVEGVQVMRPTVVWEEYLTDAEDKIPAE